MPLPLHLPYKEHGPESVSLNFQRVRPVRDYGTLQFGLLKGPGKLRASLLPIIFSIILPWALFALTYTSVASSVHISDPWQSILGVACGALLLICFFFAWLDRMVNSPDRAPSQLGFFGFSFLLAWLLGIVLGSVSYQSPLDEHPGQYGVLSTATLHHLVI